MGFKKFISNMSNKIKEEGEKRKREKDVGYEEKTLSELDLLLCSNCGKKYTLSFGEHCPHCEAEKRKKKDDEEYQKEKRFRERAAKELQEKLEQEQKLEDENPEHHFKLIIKSMELRFKPEKIRDEMELQSQLIIFLKSEYPDREIKREVPTKIGDRVDIVIDNRYAFELKVPQERETLRNLGAQLEEYSEEYPYLCAIIFNNKDPDFSETIKDYVDKYQRNFGVLSIVIDRTKKT